MSKAILFFDFAGKAAIDDVVRDLLAGPAGPLGRAFDAVPRLTVNPVFEPPENRPRRSYENALAMRPCDVVVETWGDSADAVARSAAAIAGAFHGAARSVDIYVVEERVILDHMGATSGRTPGFKYIGRHLFHEDLPLSAARRSWALHGELATRMFTKLRKYVQNIVVDCLTAGSPQATGIPQLYFESLADFSAMPAGGQEQIVHDLKYLVKAGQRLHTTEYVVASGVAA